MKEKYFNLFNFAPTLIIWKFWIEIDLSVDLTITKREGFGNSYDLNTTSRFEISWNK